MLLTHGYEQGVCDMVPPIIIMPEVHIKHITVSDSRVRLMIWDTNWGNERCRSIITRSYYQDSHAFILVYDITNQKSFDILKSGIEEVRQHDKLSIVFLVGNKLDKEGDRKVARQEAEDFAQQNGIHFFMETSTRSGKSTTNLFLNIAEQLMAKVNHRDIVAKKIDIEKRKDFFAKPFDCLDDPYKYIEGLIPELSYTQLDKELERKMDMLAERLFNVEESSEEITNVKLKSGQTIHSTEEPQQSKATSSLKTWTA